MKRKQKGQRAVRECISTFFSGEQYLICDVEKSHQFATERDLFGLGDLIVLDKYENRIILVQVTCNRPHRHIDYINFYREWCTTGIEVEQYVRYDRKGWKKFIYSHNGKKCEEFPKQK